MQLDRDWQSLPAAFHLNTQPHPVTHLTWAGGEYLKCWTESWARILPSSGFLSSLLTREYSGPPPRPNPCLLFLRFHLCMVNCGPKILHGKFQKHTIHKFKLYSVLSSAMKSHTVQPCPTWDHQPWRDDPDYPKMTLLLTYRQKVSSSLTLHHNAYVIHLTSSQHGGILSSHIITRRVSMVL